MDIFNNLKKTTEIIEKKASQSINTAKLDLKKLNYKNRLNVIYKEIGQYIHTCKNSHSEFNSHKLESLCSEADELKDKIKGLEKQISSIKNTSEKTNSKTSAQAVENQAKAENNSYSRLDKKENDLKLVKTADGIKFIKLCPDCNSINPPEAVECFNCSHKFKKI